MDKYDPEKRVNLAVDEWGILTNVVPGHGRRSLFMQNSLRDALLASLNFNIFIRHADRSEEHTSELQSLMRISYAVFCLKKKKPTEINNIKTHQQTKTRRSIALTENINKDQQH